MNDASNSSEQSNTSATTNLAGLLNCLARAIAADTDLPALAAHAQAQHIYTQAYEDYLSTGGDTHAGFVRWLDEQISQTSTVTAPSSETITA